MTRDPGSLAGQLSQGNAIMETTNTTGGIDMPNADMDRLGAAVHAMDALSCDGFGSIHTLAMSALRSLEAPSPAADFGAITKALRKIAALATDHQNCINVEACDVGMGYVSGASLPKEAARG
jgi:hypothetical protein